MAESKNVFPENMTRFHCIGGACEDNCCRAGSWKITVDDAAYEKYKTLSGEFGARILDNIVGREGGRYFKPETNERCPFLRDDELCDIVITLGEEFLCITCKTYPHGGRDFNGNREASLSLSCPEAVRLLLFDRKGIQFTETHYKGDSIETSASEATAFRIRALLFGIISYKKYTLMDKIAYMGLLFGSLDKLPAGDGFPAAVDEVLTLYKKNLYTLGILDEIHTARAKAGETAPYTRYGIMMGLARLITEMITQSVKTAPVNTLNSQLYERLGKLKQALETAGQALLVPEAYDRVMIPYISKNTYVFENYLFYMVYFTRFPNEISEYGTGYKEFVGEFLLLLIFAAGLYRDRKNLRDWETVNAIYLFHRIVSHIPSVREGMMDVLGKVVNMGVFLSLFGGLK